MAIVIPGHVVADIHGSVGSTTVKVARYGLSAQSRSRGSVRRTSASMGHLRVFSTTSAFWHALDPAARLAWHNAAGTATGGQALFQSAVMARFRMTGGWDFDPPIGGPAGVLGVVSMVATATPPTWIVSWTGRESLTYTRVGVYVCVFGSAAVQSPRGGYTGPYALGFLNDGALDLVALGDVGAEYLTEGKSLGIGLTTWVRGMPGFSGITRVRVIVGP